MQVTFCESYFLNFREEKIKCNKFRHKVTIGKFILRGADGPRQKISWPLSIFLLLVVS